MNFSLIPILLAAVIGTLSAAVFHKPKFNRNIIVKLVLSLLCFYITFGFFIKICKPAFRYTEIGFLYSSSLKIDSKSFDFSVVRNYDCFLNEDLKIPLDAWFENNILNDGTEGGFFISGDIWCTPPDSGVIYSANRGPVSVLDSLHKVAKSYYSKNNLDQDSIGIIAYTSIYEDGVNNFRLFDISRFVESCDLFDYHEQYWHYDGKKVEIRAENQKGLDINHYERVGKQGIRADMISVRQKADSICHICNMLSGSYCDKPDIIFAAEDISKVFEVLKFPRGHWTSYASKDIRSITYNYRTPIELPSKIDPEPDEVSLNYIRYTDSHKISKIVWNGLRFYVEFPELENIQNIKTVIVGALATTFATLVLRYLYIIFIYLFVLFKENVSRRTFYSCIVVLSFIIVMLFVIASYKSGHTIIDTSKTERLYGND